jgi:hypothetical protein
MSAWVLVVQGPVERAHSQISLTAEAIWAAG